VPGIYQEATGKEFQVPADDDNLLRGDDWQILKDVCGDDPMFFELQSSLLDVEREFRGMSRRAEAREPGGASEAASVGVMTVFSSQCSGNRRTQMPVGGNDHVGWTFLSDLRLSGARRAGMPILHLGKNLRTTI